MLICSLKRAILTFLGPFQNMMIKYLSLSVPNVHDIQNNGFPPLLHKSSPLNLPGRSVPALALPTVALKTLSPTLCFILWKKKVQCAHLSSYQPSACHSKMADGKEKSYSIWNQCHIKEILTRPHQAVCISKEPWTLFYIQAHSAYEHKGTVSSSYLFLENFSLPWQAAVKFVLRSLKYLRSALTEIQTIYWLL